MKRKAVVIDTYSRGSYHEVINQSYLMMISELYEDVIYIADKSSCDNMRRLLGRCGVVCENVIFQEKRFRNVNLKHPGLNYLAKLVIVSFLNYWYYVKASKDSDIFYNNNLFFATLFIHFLARKTKNIYDLCHNDMELINPSKANSATTKILSKYFCFVFNKIVLDKIFHFILLSPKMVDYFNQFISSKNIRCIFSIDHSYIRPLIKNRENFAIVDSRIKIGIPGAISPERGLGTLKRILNSLTNGNVCIYALSSCTEQIDNVHFVMLNNNNKLLPFEQYNSYVQSMDAMLLLYDKNSYKLTASGAVLEAIWNEKPIIAMHNMYFDYLFQKFGKLGVLCNNVNELVENITNFDSVEDWVNTCKLAKRQLTPEVVKYQLKRIIDNV